jgi:hypothetical protein
MRTAAARPSSCSGSLLVQVGMIPKVRSSHNPLPPLALLAPVVGEVLGHPDPGGLTGAEHDVPGWGWGGAGTSLPVRQTCSPSRRGVTGAGRLSRGRIIGGEA